MGWLEIIIMMAVGGLLIDGLLIGFDIVVGFIFFIVRSGLAMIGVVLALYAISYFVSPLLGG